MLTEIVSRRTQTAKHFFDPNNPTKRRFTQILKTPIHFPSRLDGAFDTEVNLSPKRVDNSALDGWRITKAGWHYAMGIPGDGDLAGLDGVVGFGGRQGSHWIKFRLQRVGYLHWPTLAWEDVGGLPDYDRSRLSRSVKSVTIGPDFHEINALSTFEWSDIWPGVSLRWHADGLQLKEEIHLGQNTRDNLPNPSTPANETYFCWAFKLDISDIPRWVKNGIQQNPDGDFDDADGMIELTDAADRLLAFMPTDYALADDGETRIKLRKRIYKSGGDYWLVVGAPVLDLNALPEGGITFDPTFSDQPDEAASFDNYLTSAAPDSNFGSANTLKTGGGNNHTIIKFDVSSVPSGAACDTAVLSLYALSTGQSSQVYDIFSLHDNVFTAEESNSTWNNYKSGTPWPGSSGAQTSGTDYEADASPPTITHPGNSPDAEAQADLTSGDNLNAARVAAWFGATNTNNGLGLPLGGSTQTRQWHPSNSSNPALRPAISIDYTEEGPPPPPPSTGPGVIIKIRGDYEANWISVNPVLNEREIGLEIDTSRFKVGDGVSDWLTLAYWIDTSSPHNHDADYSDINHSHTYAYVGEVRMFSVGTSYLPAGWENCDGHEINRSTELGQIYEAMGFPFGDGDGVNTCNVPDYSNRSAMGEEPIGSPGFPVGTQIGESEHTLTVDEMPNHRHFIYTFDGNTAGSAEGRMADNDQGDGGRYTQFEGGDQPHNNIHPVLATVFAVYVGE